MPDTLEIKYLSDSYNLSSPQAGVTGRVEWQCPSNIALIKYWGKRQVQIPMNPSVSFTLKDSTTRTRIDYSVKAVTSQPSLEFQFGDHPNPLFAEKLQNFLQLISRYLPFLNRMHLKVNTLNTFPHSAGIASSASAYAALALSLCNIEKELFGTLMHMPDFLQKSSFIARLGSGSACRSVYGGYALWGYSGLVEGSADEAAISINQTIHPVFMDYHDSILVVHSGAKAISSSAGHRLMEQHPFASARIDQANDNLKNLLQTLSVGDVNRFTEILENEALTLHALMFSSKPGFILLHPNTIEIINRILICRNTGGLPVGFTLDAGANVHVLYPSAIEKETRQFIDTILLPYCENGWVIHDRVGDGPVNTMLS